MTPPTCRGPSIPSLANTGKQRLLRTYGKSTPVRTDFQIPLVDEDVPKSRDTRLLEQVQPDPQRNSPSSKHHQRNRKLFFESRKKASNEAGEPVYKRNHIGNDMSSVPSQLVHDETQKLSVQLRLPLQTSTMVKTKRRAPTGALVMVKRTSNDNARVDQDDTDSLCVNDIDDTTPQSQQHSTNEANDCRREFTSIKNAGSRKSLDSIRQTIIMPKSEAVNLTRQGPFQFPTTPTSPATYTRRPGSGFGRLEAHILRPRNRILKLKHHKSSGRRPLAILELVTSAVRQELVGDGSTHSRRQLNGSNVPNCREKLQDGTVQYDPDPRQSINIDKGNQSGMLRLKNFSVEMAKQDRHLCWQEESCIPGIAKVLDRSLKQPDKPGQDIHNVDPDDSNERDQKRRQTCHSHRVAFEEDQSFFALLSQPLSVPDPANLDNIEHGPASQTTRQQNYANAKYLATDDEDKLSTCSYLADAMEGETLERPSDTKNRRRSEIPETQRSNSSRNIIALGRKASIELGMAPRLRSTDSLLPLMPPFRFAE